MLFDMSCFDKYFQDVVSDSEDSFPFVVLRLVNSIDPETRSVSDRYTVVHSGIGSWASPLEKASWDFDGVITDTQDIIFVNKPIDVKKQDVIYRSDRDVFYRVLGFVDYSSASKGSHLDLHCKTVELGTNFFPDNGLSNPHTAFLGFDMSVVV